jgi:two-component system chemotaxis response regulator CheB
VTSTPPRTGTPLRTTRLLVVDHSPTAREKLQRLFAEAADIDVVGEAGTIEKALRLLDELAPTAVLIDCDLPKPGSFAVVREMMSLHPVPIIMMTKQIDAVTPAFESQVLETGAVALACWSPSNGGTGKGSGKELVRTVRFMSEVKVVRRRDHRARVDTIPGGAAAMGAAAEVAGQAGATRVAVTPPAAGSPPGAVTAPAAQSPARAPGAAPGPPAGQVTRLGAAGDRIEIVAIGASTGGPPVLQTILGGLSRRLTVPVVLVQHLSRGFQSSLVAWLSDAAGVRIVVSEHGMPLDPGIVYLAPDDRHMAIDSAGRAVLNSDPPENGSRPSVSVLFRSVAQQYGSHAIGILLTGMGRDGAKELRLMRDRGAVTIAQDEESSVVHGMPGEAIKLKGARYILPPDRIPSVVEHHLSGASGQRANAAICP